MNSVFRRWLTPSDSTRLRWLLVILLITLYGGLGTYLITRDKPIDFYAYYVATYGFARGEDVYAYHENPTDAAWWDQLAQDAGTPAYTYPYRYPPLTAMMVWPLIFLPPRWAAAIWLTASGLAFITAAWLLGATMPSRSSGIPLALVLLLGFVPAYTTLRAGQVNGFVLLALAFALWASVRGKSTWAGVGVAAGAMLKLVPAALLAYLGWRQQWRGVRAGIITVACLFLLATPLIGWGGLASYAENFLELGVADSLIPSAPNQSLNGFFSRLFTAGPDRWHLLDAPEMARWLYLGASVALVAATAIICWPKGRWNEYFELEFALVSTAMNLITPYVWYYQFVLLLIPLFVLVKSALARPALRWMLIPLAIGYLLTDLHGLVWQRLTYSPLLSSFPFGTALLLWGLTAWLIVRGKWGRGAQGGAQGGTLGGAPGGAQKSGDVQA